jgi:hypothetical protein
MLVTYVVQAVLVTLYLAVLLLLRFDKLPQTSRNVSWISRTLVAVQHSTATFLGASFVFSIAMLLASIVTLATVREQELEGATLSTRVLATLMPISSVFPVVLLQLAASRMLRRGKGRGALWGLVCMLLIVILCLSRAFSLNHDNMAQCFQFDSMLYVRTFAYFLAGTLVLGILCYFIILSLLRRFRERHLVRKICRFLWWASIILAFLSMWACLVWFIQFQIASSKVGVGINRDTEWSFGQILALGTWVPVILEFGYLWWEKPVVAMSGRLMAPYEVVEVSKQNEGFEMTRRETV